MSYPARAEGLVNSTFRHIYIYIYIYIYRKYRKLYRLYYLYYFWELLTFRVLWKEFVPVSITVTSFSSFVPSFGSNPTQAPNLQKFHAYPEVPSYFAKSVLSNHHLLYNKLPSYQETSRNFCFHTGHLPFPFILYQTVLHRLKSPSATSGLKYCQAARNIEFWRNEDR